MTDDTLDVGARDHEPPRPPICFVHIPKTAGLTLREVLARVHPDCANAGNWLNDRARTVEKVARRNASGRSALMGHIPYAVYRATMPPDAVYITLLREPIHRVVSYYFRHVHRREHRTTPPMHSVTEALDAQMPELINLATRFLCDDPSVEPDRSSLEQAKHNLARFALVGFQERFDESIVALHQALGLEELTCYGPSRHVNEHRPPMDVLSERQRRLIRERNALDEELYAYAWDTFGARLTRSAGVAAAIERIHEMRAPLVAEYATKRRDVESWLEQQLPPGTTRTFESLKRAAEANDFEVRIFRDVLMAARGSGRMLTLVLSDEQRLVTADSRLLRLYEGPRVFLDANESRAVLQTIEIGAPEEEAPADDERPD